MADFNEYKGVWVFCEQRQGKLMPTDFELVSEARKLADELNCEVTGLLLGDNVEGIAKELGGYGADKVMVCDSPLLKDYTTDAYAKVVCDMVNEYKPEVLLIGATNIGRDLGPRCAARLHTGLTADATHLDIDTAKYIDFLKETPVIDFNTLYQDNRYKIISVFIINTNEEHGEVFDYTKYVYFKNSDEFYKYILEVMDRSKYNTGVDVEYGDELLTLSTCDGSTGFEDLRLVIVARKVRENESPEVDTSKITWKNSVKYFDAYNNAFGDKWKGRTWDTSLVPGIDEYIKKNGLEDDPANYQ